MFCPSRVFADTGPKPSVKITIHGLQEKAYVTLLSKEASSGPFGVYENDEETDHFNNEFGPDEVWKAFINYQDKDGFYFISYFQECTDTFQWNYYPPNEFKVLIYFPESQSFITSSKSYERYAFESFYTISLDQQASFPTQKGIHEIDMDIKKEIFFNEVTYHFIERVVVTILIELLIALCFQIKKKRELKIIVLTNIATQILLNFMLQMLSVYYISVFAFLCYTLLEIAVIYIEAKIYQKYMKDHSKGELIGYATVANILSLLIGFAI
ncbi:hypothetical protein [Longibaculum muris]|nr:hypothetical protein [Longibaculum muris]